MDGSKRSGWIAGVTAVAIGCALATSASSWAAPVEMAPQSSQRTTFDGWNLTVALSGEVINAVPNLAGAQNSREAFMTLSAQANIGGNGSNPVTAANFVAGYQVGCQIDVSQGLQIGGTGQLAGSVGATISGQPGVQVGGTGAIGGFVQTDLQPGVITTVAMGTMPVTAGVGRLDMQDVHLKVDACGGPVTVRSYATFAVASAVQQTQLSVYGDPYVLN
ncbi:MAG: MspA family porin [Mycobacterium sp.]